MMNRYLARTLVILVVAALPVIGLASPAHAKETKFKGSVAELKKVCGPAFGGAYSQSNDGTFGVCITKDHTTICDDNKSGKNCTQDSVRGHTRHLLLEVLFIARSSSASVPCRSGQPTTGGNAGNGGSTNTTGRTNTTSTTTTTKLPPTNNNP